MGEPLVASPDLETFLARLYTDKEFLNEFKNNPDVIMSAYNLSDEEKKSVLQIDHEELELASHGFRKKREYVISQVPKKIPFWKKWLYKFLR